MGVLALAAVCVVALGGCRPYPRGYIVPENGEFVLKMIPGCDSTFTQVEVGYQSYASGPAYGATDEERVWSVSFRDPAGVSEVELFSQPANADSEFLIPDIDWSREVMVRWTERGDFSGRVSGVLADIEPGFVLWQGGFEDAREFADKVPRRAFGC